MVYEGGLPGSITCMYTRGLPVGGPNLPIYESESSLFETIIPITSRIMAAASQFAFCGSKKQYTLMRETEEVVKNTNFYWGQLSSEAAHSTLSDTPRGTFLLRDGSDPMYLFALSYSASPCPTSSRIKVGEMGFSFEAEPAHRFPTLCSLLKHYQDEGKITTPHRRKEPELKGSDYVNMSAPTKENLFYVDTPTHKQYALIKETESHVNKASFFWGPLSIVDAHSQLSDTPLGTFLLRNSSDPMYLCALSYSASPRPRSTRIKVEEKGLSLESEPGRKFPNLCALLKHYQAEGKITSPHQRKEFGLKGDDYEKPVLKEEERVYVNMQLHNLGML